MPAEFEPHAATWLAWPHNPETWPGCLDEARDEYQVLVSALAEREPVRMIVPSVEERARVARRVPGTVELFVVPSDDSWMRDIGPTFVHDRDERVAIDWTFNAWGGRYPPWDRDDRVAAAVARHAGVRSVRPDLCLEGGALETDGCGTLLCTRSSLLGPSRNPGLERAELEARLHELLGARVVVWLDAELAGDDTDAHVDNVARFVAPGHVLCVVEDDPDDPNCAGLASCRKQLDGARDAQGRALRVTALPLPEPVVAAGERLPASYANFYVANGCVLIPVFGVPRDAEAVERIAQLFPGREAVAIPCRTLVRGLGTLHCLSQQEPAPAGEPGVG